MNSFDLNTVKLRKVEWKCAQLNQSYYELAKFNKKKNFFCFDENWTTTKLKQFFADLNELYYFERRTDNCTELS